MKLEGRVVVEEFDCEALKGNPLGDPHQRSVPIYLPPGYERSGRRISTARAGPLAECKRLFGIIWNR